MSLFNFSRHTPTWKNYIRAKHWVDLILRTRAFRLITLKLTTSSGKMRFGKIWLRKKFNNFKMSHHQKNRKISFHQRETRNIICFKFKKQARSQGSDLGDLKSPLIFSVQNISKPPFEKFLPTPLPRRVLTSKKHSFQSVNFNP